jgi:Fe-S oxidoreductase
MQAFAEFKALWDPLNRMNPGKLIDPVAVYEPTDNLRIDAGYKPAEVKTWFQFPADQGSFAEATERCVGVGACRKDHGTMCPSYMATREEKHSTRGRAHLLWELMQGNVLRDGWLNREVKDALDLCLSCKACKTECPVNVDMATWKAEFLAHFYAGRIHPLHHYGFGFMDRWARVASVAPSLVNLPGRTPGIRSLVKSVLGIAPQRSLPRLATKSFRDQFNRANRTVAGGEPVLLWPDTWNNYFHPQALTSAAKLLTAAGTSIQIPRRHVCCGRPLYDFGFLDQARSYLLRILDQFEAQIAAGIPVVMLEPSCASVFRDELLNFFPRDERAIRLSRQTVMLSEILAQRAANWQAPQLPGRRIIVHGHCHQKSLMTIKDEMKLLRSTGAEVELLDSGCCGMAGPFGFELDKFAVSQALAERVLLPAVRAAGEHDLLVSNGFSCREQISQNTPRTAVHLAEVLAGDCRGLRDTVTLA